MNNNVIMRVLLMISAVCFMLIPTVGMAAETSAANTYVPDSQEEVWVLDRINNYNVESDFSSAAYAVAAGGLSGSCQLNKSSSAQANITGTTRNSTTATLTVSLQLQYYKNGSWTGYPGGTTTAQKSGTSVSVSKALTVTKGYSYRVVATHVGGGKTTQSISGSQSF